MVMGCFNEEPEEITYLGKISTGYDPYSAEKNPNSVPHVAPQPLSDVLGCGQPCKSFDVSSKGACAGSVAVKCEDGTVVCSDCDAQGKSCLLDDAVTCKRECEGEIVCPDPSSCFERVCCPNTRWCEKNAMMLCDETGREVREYPCNQGLDCYDNGCRPARPYVLVLFDSSGSMTGIVGGAPSPSASKWPACDDVDDPVRRLGKSKKAFSELFGNAAYTMSYSLSFDFHRRLTEWDLRCVQMVRISPRTPSQVT